MAPDTGYRYYSTRQLECLNTIRYLRVLEMPLEQIREFLQNREVEKIQEMLQQQKEVVVQKQRALEIVQRKIENRLRQIQDALASELDVIRQVDMPARRIAWLHDTLTPKTYLDLEPSIRQLEQPAQESVVFLGKVGVGISRARLEEGTYTEYDRVFLLLDQEGCLSGERGSASARALPHRALSGQPSGGGGILPASDGVYSAGEIGDSWALKRDHND